ncbi:MAG: hypothetical protein IIA83_03760 [Thaumarchaeota archaeon]|nr:hypothetical protein [Nitrososphaerota archaeon]
MNKKIISAIVISIVILIIVPLILVLTSDNNKYELEGKSEYFIEIIDNQITQLHNENSIVDFVVWKEGQRLTIEDFIGSIPHDASPDVTGQVNVGLDTAPRIIPDFIEGEPCSYTIIKIESVAILNRDKSWLEEKAKNEKALNHEQRHFDIAEIHARIFKEHLEEFFSNKIFPCPETFSESLEIAIINEIYDISFYIHEEMVQRVNQVQNQYEIETDAGRIPEAQKKWDDKIDSCLYGDWFRIEDCLNT